MPATVLIASPEHLSLLKERKDLGETIAFADTDTRRALDVITRQPPNVVALERVFAATSRGAALINRIKADPTLTACEIRIVAYDSNYVRVAPLDQRGTRRAPRVGIVDGVEVQIDGNPAFLVNLSLVGADVVSVTILKPNQHVRVTLADPRRPMRIRSAVVWSCSRCPKVSLATAPASSSSTRIRTGWRASSKRTNARVDSGRMDLASL